MKKDDHKRERAKKLMGQAGYKKGGSVAEKFVHEHEAHMHPGKPKTKLKRKDGGYVGGNTPKPRLDKPGRKSHDDAFAKPALKKEKYARGGAAKGGKTTVNVIIAGKDGDKGGAPMMMPPGGPARPPVMPPAGGAPVPPPGAGLPPGVPPRPQMANRGGKIHSKKDYPIDAGSGSGEGRLEKAAAAKKTHGGKKRGK